MQEKYNLASIKSTEFDFGGGSLSSESGMLLFHEYMDKRGILSLFQEKYPENRGDEYVHQKPDLLYQQIQLTIAGYTNNNVVSHLQQDPVYRHINQSNGLASAATVCRWAKSWKEEDRLNLQHIHDELIETYYAQISPEKIIVDIDTTYDPASETLEGVSYNSHYEETGYSPMIAFDGITGLPLRGNLRPGNKYCNQGAESFLDSLFQKLPMAESLVYGLFCRADSGFACPEVYEACERRSVTYVIKLPKNEVLTDMVDEYCFCHKVQPNPEETQIFYFGNLYQAGSWDKKRRVVFKVIFPAGELFPTYQAIITNDTTMIPEEIFDFYSQRAVCENWIEEGKNGFSWDHLSLKTFLANQTRFLVFLLAMLLFRLFQLDTMNETWQKKTVQTIRIEFFRVASKLVLGGRKFFFRLSSSFAFQETLRECYQRIQKLSWSFVLADP
jgi:hypothetical protein